MPIDLDDESTTDFEGRRGEVRAEYEQRLITAKEYRATLEQIDADEDEYLRRRGDGEPAAEPESAEAAPGPSAQDKPRP